MTTFYQRLRHPFRRPTHYSTITEPSQTPRQLEKQQEREKQRALDEVGNDLDDGRARPRGSCSPESLPVMNDRGPCRGSLYPKDQLYFNSIMLATDVEPTSSRLPGGKLRQETGRNPIRCPRKGKDRSPSPRPVPSEWLTAPQNAEMLRRWEQRHGIDIMPPCSWFPSRMQSSPRPLSPPREPIIPGTQEWDKFMGFPMDNFQPVGHSQSSKKPARTTIASNPLVRSEPAAVTKTQPTLVWTSALSNILRNRVIDTAIRATITERSERSSSKRKSGHEGTFPITLADANLVLNFSYPIASSRFYGRIDGAQASLKLSSQVEDYKEEEQQRYEEQLSNDTCPDHCVYASSSNTIYRDPMPPNWPLRGRDDDQTSITNGASPGYYLRSSSDESRDFSLNPRQRSPLPPNLIPEQVSVLLHSILTPSELALHLKIVRETAALGTSPHHSHEPTYRESPVTPLGACVIQKLDIALHGLQDRISGLEENLIPQLSIWLEQKNDIISEQNVDISCLIDETIELKHIADFGNKVLSRCRERDCEVWNTLLDIQRKRQERHGSVARLLSRARSSLAQALSPTIVDKGSLKKKELEALLLMAKQNVEILDEDMMGMAERLQTCLARNSGTENVDRPAEGSWKDV